jgi:hypothetical protein
MVSIAVRIGVFSVLFGLCESGDVAVCPGEGDRYGDHKCNHDPTHRVCAQLLGLDGKPLEWGKGGDFWQITGQKAFQWDAEIKKNKGDSWCICMWATAHLITAAGCDNVHLHCNSTDVKYVLGKYTDGGVDLEPAKACLAKKCPEKHAAALSQMKASNLGVIPSPAKMRLLRKKRNDH